MRTTCPRVDAAELISSVIRSISATASFRTGAFPPETKTESVVLDVDLDAVLLLQ